jgi:membrane protease YdiL (CAAX protease family)
MEATIPGDKLGVILKLGVFAFIAIAGLALFSPVLYATLGYLAASALGTFAAAAVGNAVAIRIFERGRLIDVGFVWDEASPRHLIIGFASGLAAACLILVPPLVAGGAHLEPVPEQPANAASFIFVTLSLLFGVVGEEMLFRGYAFQLLLGVTGRFATLLPVSVIFGLAHTHNQNASALGIANTIGFGIVLGYAFLRSGDLWLPIGLHFGWNWTLPLFGVNLSGFTMTVTGYVMRWKVSDLWSGGNYGPEGSILTSGVIVLLLVYLNKAPIRWREPFLLTRSLPESV